MKLSSCLVVFSSLLLIQPSSSLIFGLIPDFVGELIDCGNLVGALAGAEGFSNCQCSTRLMTILFIIPSGISTGGTCDLTPDSGFFSVSKAIVEIRLAFLQAIFSQSFDMVLGTTVVKDDVEISQTSTAEIPFTGFDAEGLTTAKSCAFSVEGNKCDCEVCPGGSFFNYDIECPPTVTIPDGFATTCDAQKSSPTEITTTRMTAVKALTDWIQSALEVVKD